MERTDRLDLACVLAPIDPAQGGVYRIRTPAEPPSPRFRSVSLPSIEESWFAAAAISSARVTPFPQGPFRFFALDVETANNHRGSICQIGVACVRPDNSIETWVTLVNPQTRIWLWSGLHGITAERVEGAPTFADVLPVLEGALRGHTVYQHSGFDRSAVAAACADIDLVAPAWLWHNSVQVARAAWPELKGNGGHGLASLKAHLGLRFNHHDAGEDARAAAEVVLHAQGVRPVSRGKPWQVDDEAF